MVNGQGRDPLYSFLTSQCSPPDTILGDPAYFDWSPVQTTDITWNFEKFLINKDGTVFKRYDPPTMPSSLVDDIEYLLAN